MIIQEEEKVGTFILHIDHTNQIVYTKYRTNVRNEKDGEPKGEMYE